MVERTPFHAENLKAKLLSPILIFNVEFRLQTQSQIASQFQHMGKTPVL